MIDILLAAVVVLAYGFVICWRHASAANRVSRRLMGEFDRTLAVLQHRGYDVKKEKVA